MEGEVLASQGGEWGVGNQERSSIQHWGHHRDSNSTPIAPPCVKTPAPATPTGPK